MIMISVVNKNFGLELNYAETFLMLKDIVEKNGEKKPPEICLKLTNPPENEGGSSIMNLLNINLILNCRVFRKCQENTQYAG